MLNFMYLIIILRIIWAHDALNYESLVLSCKKTEGMSPESFVRTKELIETFLCFKCSKS